LTIGTRLLTVRHVTVYSYSEPVKLGEHRMMFRPRGSHDLHLVQIKLDISPAPKGLRWLHDVFDNSIAAATFGDTNTTELRFESTVTLEHRETASVDYTLEPAARLFPFHYSDEDAPDLVRARMRHYPGDGVTAWAERFMPTDGPIDTVGLLESISSSINREFTYVRRPEKGVQTPEDTLTRRSGSCRDFALFMMEAVRSLGLAARFVSGYIFAPEGTAAATVGGGSTHGWMQAYLPGAGWVDFDPTNSIVGNRNLIRVAVAWDQRNALPLWGTFIGPASSFLGMDVDVRVVEALLASPPLTQRTARPPCVPSLCGPAERRGQRRRSRKCRSRPGSSWSAGDRGTRAARP
jgi:transglutaminase-like putative cysteine protease